MIICPWKDIKKYAALLPGIEEAFDAVNALTVYENGAVHPLSNGNRFFVCALTTKEPDVAEAHRKYLDIQYVVKGKEVMGWADLDACSPAVPFSEEKAKEILLEKEIEIKLTLGDGPYSASAWGCDLTYDYVKINGDYRT